MLKKRGRRRLWAVLGTMLLAAALGVCALAASDVPKAVLNARESVVRIVTEGAMGSGFALSENSVYVVTNHHVIEGAETIEVIVDDTRWTTARVYVDLPGKDICILKTDKPLRGMPGLPLRSDAVETGLAVYALGYPGAADDFSREFATGVDSITVTDGIVSAVRQSRAEGLQTTWAIQTNAPISPGNSGGPLVDAGGRLVGINTFIMLEGQNVNGSIHVRELLTVLQQNDIPYRKAAPGFAGVLLVVLAVAAALGVCAALLLRLSGVREAHAGKGCSAACVFGRRRTDGQAPGNAGGAGAGATAGFDAGGLAGAASGKYPCAERYAGAEACARRGQKARRLRVRRVFRTGMLQRKRGYGRCSLFSGGRAVCAYRGPRPAGRDRACGRRGAGV